VNENMLLTKVKNQLNIQNWESVTSQQKSQAVIFYLAYHNFETEGYRNYLNQLCEIKLDRVIPVCMKDLWSKKDTLKYPWVQDYAELVQDDVAKQIFGFISDP